MKAQTIQIDSTFTSDGKIFPFSPNDTIYGLSISGSVTLLSDTSLVRVILTDNSGNEWMVYEAYPMIVTDTAFEIVEECDETCYLPGIVPSHLLVQIFDSQLEILNLGIESIYIENIAELRTLSLKSKELLKISKINNFLEANEMLWRAGETSISKLSYNEKKSIFGDKYCLLGYDFYLGGIYAPYRITNSPPIESNIVGEFDWRNRHGASDQNKLAYYFDGNQDVFYEECNDHTYSLGEYGNGWMTAVKTQKINNHFSDPLCKANCTGTCYIFSTIGAIEALVNLYFIRKDKGLDMSEQQILTCKGACPCDGGYISYASSYVKLHGVIDEEHYPWQDEDGSCNETWISNGNYQVNVNNYEEYVGSEELTDIDFIKESIITNGPLCAALHYPDPHDGFDHAMTLLGFGTIREGEIFHTPYGGEIVAGPDDDGKLYWIFKQSYSPSFGDGGYVYHLYDEFFGGNYFTSIIKYQTPIDDLKNQLNETRECFDKDSDGYCFWGIGSREGCQNCESCPSNPDSDDSERRIGPYADDYSGIPVSPDMRVFLYKELQCNNEVENGSFFYVDNSCFNSNQILEFLIRNEGTAQLNLSPFGNVVSLTGENANEFQVLDSFLDRKVMFGQQTSFEIKYLGNPSDNLTKSVIVNIAVSEPEIQLFQFDLVINGCQTLSGVDPIDGQVSWPESFKLIQKDVRINTGAVLTITGNIAFSGESDLYIVRGGRLIINGGKLSGSCSGMWNGIDVWGNASMPQEQTYQGIVELLNGGIIEFADTAISTYKTDGTAIINTGGIIHSSDAFFKDNYVGICLSPYSNPNGGGNKSTFIRSQFIITDEYYQPGNIVRTSPKCGVQMSWVNGINFEGCSFINNSTADKRKRGCGISNMDADFHVKNACENEEQPGCEPTIPSRFEGLDYGIRSLNNWSFRRMSVESADFIDNFKGICLSMNLDAALVKNNFYLNADNGYFKPGDTLIGIYTDVCSRYQMENNKFVGADPDHFELVGMHILNSGEDYNEVFNNIFENLDYGVVAVGKNKNKDGSSGLCIKCNNFSKCRIDVYVTPGVYDPKLSGIATNQGEKNIPPATEPDLAAGNTFSDVIVDENNYLNDNSLTTLQYVHHYTGSTNENVLPEFFTNIFPDQDDAAAYSKELSCPSNLQREGLILSNEQSQFDVEKNAVYSLEDSLDVIIDGGDTPGLNFEILTSFSDDALQLHQDLLDKSPYLSDTILKSAIERENVLLNPMIRDVLVANPQAAKEHSIIEKLNERLDPLPDYMIEEIAEGQQYYGAKELALQNLASHKKKMAKSLSNIAWLLKKDTIASRVCDSLIAVLESTEQLKAMYETAFLCLSKKDTVSANSILNIIPQQFNLNAPLQNEHESYLELFYVLHNLQADSCIIDSALIQRLFDLTNYENSLPGIYSRNLLESKNLLFYDETVYLANIPTKGYSIVSSNKDNEEAKSPYLEIFPNPSNSFFIIKYDLREFNSVGTILISDQAGKIIKMFSINDRQNQKIVETSTLSSGMYLVSLYVNDKLKANAKLIIR